MKEIVVDNQVMNEIRHLTISTPGRICLFGEHQDYLHLPVIPAAISLRMTIEGIPRKDQSVRIQLPDIDGTESFSIAGELAYERPHDYFRSAVNVLRRKGVVFSHGFDCLVRGNIPINAGTSSSSALVVSWVNFLARMSDRHEEFTPELLAQYAIEAEVLEFSEAGGMMDQYSTALGGLLFIDFHPAIRIERITTTLKTFVLGDSREAKNTQTILSGVKNRVLNIVNHLAKEVPSFSLHRIVPSEIDRWKSSLSQDQAALLEGTVRNHMITLEAKKLLANNNYDDKVLGNLLNEHQVILRDVLNISTPKIDKMLDAAMNAGAYGGKINGSGGGGCMFAYAPERPEHVAEAIRRVGGIAYIVNVDAGTRVDVEERGM